MKTFARVIFGLTALCSIVGMIMATIQAADSTAAATAALGDGLRPEVFDSVWSRVLNVFSYFTIQSNILVTVISIILLINPYRTSDVFRVFRLMGLGAIIITGLVYNLVLLPLLPPHGFSLVFNVLLHMATPLLAVVGWLVWGPRIPYRQKYMWLALLFGVWWIGMALIRGAIIKWYNYPFLDVDKLGYGRVTINILVIVAFFIGIALGIMGLDKVLPDRSHVEDEGEDEVGGTASAAGS
ncbi:MAG TPA: Pr6Pr family membrane protein [Actinomycetota bacterium]|mgnify:CR=1 FL=1|nr:Pr6Pr family membrane protein [Actinomycetota bacterium]